MHKNKHKKKHMLKVNVIHNFQYKVQNYLNLNKEYCLWHENGICLYI